MFGIMEFWNNGILGLHKEEQNIILHHSITPIFKMFCITSVTIFTKQNQGYNE